MGHKWYDDLEEFEHMRQNFTTTFLLEGPNMTLEEMSEKLTELQEELQRLRRDNKELRRVKEALNGR